jgi:hypothetical protein
MSVYKKLQEARIALYNLGIKQSGNNKHSGYSYYELADFTIDAQRIFGESGLSSNFSLTEQTATLLIIDVESGETAAFSCPVFLASIPKEAERGIKALGATITYLRRYLWMLAMEIPASEVAELVKNHENSNKPEYTVLQVDHNIEKWKGGIVSSKGMIEKIRASYLVTDDVEQYITEKMGA